MITVEIGGAFPPETTKFNLNTTITKVKYNEES